MRGFGEENISYYDPQGIDVSLQPANFLQKAGAFFIDLLLLTTSWIILLIFFSVLWFVAIPLSPGIFFVISALYFSILDSHIGGGATLRKKCLGIRVINKSCQMPSVKERNPYPI